MNAARDLVWDGCINVRDLGGLPAEDGGETRFGSLIRADTLGYLTREGWESLIAFGVTRIVDLREQFELDNDPPRELHVEVVHVPILDHYDEEKWLEIQALSDAAPTHAAATELVYRRFLDHCRPRFVEAVEALASAPGTAVFHCHGGKDRTGLLAALLLRLAGVSIAAISDDYALSGVRLQPRHERWLASAESDEERARIERISATPAAAMQAVLEALDADYGGAERYLVEGGLRQASLTAVRSRLR